MKKVVLSAWYREPLEFVWKLTQANPPAEQRVVRILKVARTVADLEGAERISNRNTYPKPFSTARSTATFGYKRKAILEDCGGDVDKRTILNRRTEIEKQFRIRLMGPEELTRVAGLIVR